MAKQIIVTKDNYGIEIIASLVNKNKESVDITGQIVEVVIVDNNDTIVDKVEAQHIDSSRGIVSITLQKEHTSTIGLYKTYWSSLDENNNVTAQEDIYYYCKDKNGGASNDSYVQEEKFDNESIIDKFKETDAEIEGIKQELSYIHKVNVNAEVVDARGEYDTLGERLDVVDNDLTGVHLEMKNINASLDNKASLNTFGYSKIKNKLNPPNNFEWNNAPINIYKTHNGEISHDLDIKIYEYKGKTYYVDIEKGLGDNDGLTEETPLSNIQSAINKTDCEVVVICGGIYYHSKGYGSTGISVNKKLTIKAKEGTKPIIRCCGTNFLYTLVDGTTYKTTRSGVGRVFDASRIDGNGDYLELTKKTSLDEVKSINNTYFIDGSDVYINTIDGRTPDNDILLLFNNINTITVTENLYIEGIEIQGGKNCLVTSSNNKNEFFANNCTFKYSTDDDGLQAKFGTTIVSNCLSAKNTQDGFSYSGNNVIEVNCIGRDNGNPNDITLANTQNGSTQHNGGKVIRVNNEYYRNKGSNCGDTHDGTKSWNLGCLAYESKSTENRYNSNFTAHIGTEMWLDSCVSYNSKNDNCIQDGSTMHLNYELFLCNSTYLEGTGKVDKY